MSRFDVPLRHVALTLVVLLAVAPFAAYAMPGLIGADESYIVLTGSMRPAYAPGDVVFVSATPAASIAVGDVITFERGAGPTTTHRVIEVVDASGDIAFRTMGDNNEDPDAALVRADQVVGVVTFAVPVVGTVITAADSQYGFLALVVVPFALLLLDVGYGALLARRPDAQDTDGDITDGDAIAAAAGDDALPTVYDSVEAARSYYEQAVAAEAAVQQTALTGRDMLASIAVAAVLLVYAAWNAYWQFEAFGQPRAETMSVVSGALVGIAFLLYLRYTAGGASQSAGPAQQEPAPAQPVAPESTAPEQAAPGPATAQPVAHVNQPAQPSAVRPQPSGMPIGIALSGAAREEEVANAD